MAQNDPWAEFIEVPTAGPSLPERKMVADITQSGASAANDAASAEETKALLPYKVRQANAEAAKAEAEVRKGPALTDAEVRAKGASDRANIVRGQILAGIDMYRKNIAGQPLDRGFGYLEKMDKPSVFGLVPAVPSYEEFTTHNNAILPLIRPLVAQTSKEGDSDKEMTIFQAYIPAAGDNDRTIETKYAALSALIDGMTDGKPPSEVIKSGLQPRSVDAVERDILRRLVPQASDPSGRISPLQSHEAAYDTARAGDSVVSTSDQEATAKIQQAFDRGASADELRKLASDLYGDRARLKDEQLPAAIAYRDKFLAGGGRGPSGVTVYPAERPMTRDERQNAERAEKPGTAFFANLGNALTLNTAPDIAGVFNPAEEQNMRASLATAREAQPGASFAGEALGSILPALTMTRGLSAIPGISRPAAALASDVGSGAIVGAAESPDNRIGGAAVGAGLGGLGAIAGRYGIDPLTQAALDRVVKRAPKPAFTQTAVAKHIGDPLDALTRLTDAERLGLPMGLADTSTEAQALAGRVARKSPEGANLAEGTYPERQLGRPDRAIEGVERDVAGSVVLRDREDDIRHAARNAAAPLYDKAFSRPAPVNNKQLQSLLNTPTGREAMKRAYDMAADEGVDPLAMGFSQAPDGTVTLSKGLSWETLDKIRNGVTSRLDDFRDPVTRKLVLTNNRPAQSVNTYLHRLTSHLDDLNPDYKAARAAYEEGVAPINYLHLGLDAADPEMRVPDVERVLSDIARMPPEKQPELLQAFREGFATRAKDQITNRPQGSDAYATVFGSPAQKRKMALIGLTPDDFATQAALEQRMARTASETQAQPMQQSRNAADSALDSSHIAQAAIETGISGAPLLTGTNLARNIAYNRGLWHSLRDRYRDAAQNMTAAKASELAPTLMGTDPTAAIQALVEARGALGAREAAEATPRALSTLAGGALAQGITGTSDAKAPVPLSIGADLPIPGETEEDRQLRSLLRRYNMQLPGVPPEAPDPGLLSRYGMALPAIGSRY